MTELTITRQQLADLDAKLRELDRQLDESQRLLLVHAFAQAQEANGADDPEDDPEVAGFGGPGRTMYEGVTVDRGVTVSQSFANWLDGAQSARDRTRLHPVDLTILDR